MVQVTRNFLAESPLAPEVRASLLDAFDQGWHDPRKLSQGASKAAHLRSQAIEAIAEALCAHPTEIEIIGEPALGYFLAVAGLLRPASTFIHSAVDRKEILTMARASPRALELPVDIRGKISAEQLRNAPTDGVVVLQGANGETGVKQDLDLLIDEIGPGPAICLDLTSSGGEVRLPTRWDSAIYDARSWRGPAGLGVLAIKNGSSWRNPLPHLSSIRTPHSFSLPLLIASAVALESWKSSCPINEPKLRALSNKFRSEILTRIPNCDIAGDLDSSLPHITSLSVLYVQGEELLRDLEKKGFLVDSGSACTAEDLQPSHVLAAMGLLTHGNIRITLRPEISSEDIDEFIAALIVAVEKQRQA